jgi:energy-coupling factor transporter ATP-binding protein EcfA2
MFTELHLKHFKAWREPVQVKLAPVTLLLGTNSSGKSSLLQSLLLLKQTVSSPDRTVHLNLGGDETNDIFSFGSFDDVLSAGATPRQFEIGFRFEQPAGKGEEAFPARAAQASPPGAPVQGAFHASYGSNSARAPVVQRLQLSGTSGRFRLVRRERGAYSVFVGEESQPRERSRSCAPERSIALSAEAIAALGTEGGLAQDLSLAVRRELEGIAYLGPLRRPPQRDYVWNKTRPGALEPDGHKVVDLLFASALSRRRRGDPPPIINDVSHWLRRMGLADQLEVRQVGRSLRYEIVIRRGKTSSNLRDVGIGVSQVLPVLALAFFVPPGGTVVLEEPETHLHPLAQAILAELFVEISRERQVQFVVETHSEHLFRRLQTLLAREQAAPEQCRLYFVEEAAGNAALRPLPLDEFGRVLDWPDGFFGDSLGETREQALALIERQKRQRRA